MCQMPSFQKFNICLLSLNSDSAHLGVAIAASCDRALHNPDPVPTTLWISKMKVKIMRIVELTS